MKVLHISPTYYPAAYWGGPIFSVYALNNALAKLPDVELNVLTTDSAGPNLNDRIDTATLDGLYPDQNVIMARRILGVSISTELLRRLPGLIRNADVVHLTASYSFPAIPTLLLCRLYQKPIVWSPRGAILDAHEWKGSRKRLVKRLWEMACNVLLKSGMAITHTTSAREKAVTQARLPKSRAVIIPNGVDIPSSISPRLWMPNGRLRLMYLGRLSPKKGIENLIRTLGNLHDPSIELTIYGSGDSGYTKQLTSLAESLGLLGNCVQFAGHVDGNAKHAAFMSADVCIVPSYTENFCMVVAEALAHSVPVIASKGTPWQSVEEKGCGFWVDNTPESLADAINRIRHCDLPVMGQIGRGWMKQEFSWESVASRMFSTYKNLLSDSSN